MRGLIPTARKFIKRNSSTILTCVGAAGVVTTTVLAIKATPKAIMLLDKAEYDKQDELTKMEVIKVAGPEYIPTIISGAATIACIFGANVLNKRQQASLASAYALLQNSYNEYKNKVIGLVGKDTDVLVRHEIAKDKYKECEIESTDGKILFFDNLSLSYFESTLEDVRDGLNALNEILNIREYATVNEYFSVMGLPLTDYGDSIGWSIHESTMIDGYFQIEFDTECYTMDDGGRGLECIYINPLIEPSDNFLY